MASINAVLAPELLDRVFSFLNERSDVAACRLVCPDFARLSSPYLMTRIVLAKRLDTMKRFREVLEHPYFSKQITELVYDASRFNRLDWISYVNRCETPHREMLDHEWVELQNSASSYLRDLMDFTSLGTDLTTPSEGRDYQYPLLDAESSDGVHPYMMGCNRTISDYDRNIEVQEFLEDKGIPLELLKQAFTRLPKLRTVTLTDYRGLARNGESYDSCCRRLFGNMPEPDRLTEDPKSWIEFLNLIHAISAVPTARVESFSLGPHPFEPCILNTNALGRYFNGLIGPQMPQRLAVERLNEAFENQNSIPPPITIVFAHLKRLFLQLEFGYDSYNATQRCCPKLLGMKKMLGLTVSTLTHLTVSATSPAFDVASEAVNPDFLLSLDFERLKYLDLRYSYVSDIGALMDFFRRHSSTLRQLRVLESRIDHDEATLAKWAGANLSLDGVEIRNVADVGLPEYTSSRTRSSRTSKLPRHKLSLEARESLWLAGGKNHLRPILDRTYFKIEEEEPHIWHLRPVRV